MEASVRMRLSNALLFTPVCQNGNASCLYYGRRDVTELLYGMCRVLSRVLVGCVHMEETSR